MKKTLRNILTAGLTSLALAGCRELPNTENFIGTFRGYETSVFKYGNSSRVTIIAPGFDWNRLIASDFDNDGNFDEITLAAVSIDDWKRAGLSPSELYKYANSDSLRLAYNEVLAQNHRR
jgi:hypothetical protein